MNIGRYEIIKELGQGAMGVVYQAKDSVLGRIVAVKTIKLQGSGSETEHADLIKRFYQEARIAGKMIHPNITMIHDVGEDKGIHYIVMEYVEGITLDIPISGKLNLSIPEKAQIITQAAHALNYAHMQGIIHRDIKPANIMLLKNLQIKIMDFGIGKILSQEALLQTQTGMIIGTPAYMSPEQISGLPLDRQTDIFSLGILAYEILTTKRLFSAENLPVLFQKIISEDPSPPCRLDPKIPESLSAIVLKALEKKKERRYLTAGEFADALELFTAQLEMKKTDEVFPQKDIEKKNLTQSLRENYPFFWDFSDEELKKIFQISSKKVFKKGEVVFQEGTMGNKMFIIISGEIRITKQFNSNEETILNQLKPGDCLGEMGVIGSTPRFATATTESDCILIAISEVILRNSEPLLCVKLFKNLSTVLAEKLKKSDTELHKLKTAFRKTEDSSTKAQGIVKS